MNAAPPSETKVVIVGGGIVGCSVAYHLAKLGCKDVVLLEQNELAGGTTWHAAGLVGRLRTTNSMTRINKYSAELYAGLERETGHSVGWKQVGSLIVARSQDRMTQLRRTAAMSEWFGVEVQLISPEAAREKWPLLRIDDLLGAAWLPHDGKVVPKEVALALAKGARSRGATVLENVRVIDVLCRDGRAVGVRAQFNDPGTGEVSPQEATPHQRAQEFPGTARPSPSPGGEGRGEGERVLQSHFQSRRLASSGNAEGRPRTDDPRVVASADTFDIQAEFVILTGGMWTRQLGLRCGVSIPLHPVEHHYVVTEPIDGAFDELPVGRDPDLCIYFRGEGNAVMLGAFQALSKPWMVERVPANFSFRLLEPDWEKFAEPLKNGKWRIPALESCRFAKFVNGPESFTPDNNFILGETPELRNLFVAAGFNSVGIASAGGAGKYLAEWIIEGQPTVDLWSADIRRFGDWANNRRFLRERVTEVLGLHYQMSWPNREFESGRGLRRTPLHERLAAAGACFGVKNGWERPNWFARPNTQTGTPATHHASRLTPHEDRFADNPAPDYSFGRQNWFANHAAEHRAARASVALFDQTGFSKFIMKGRAAVAVLQRLCGNNVDVAIGRTVYSGLFNERGGIESDLTLVRTGPDEFYIITGTAQAVRDSDWIRRHIRGDEEACLVEVTGAFGVLGVMGPDSRALLSRLTEADLSNAAFPFGTAQRISIGPAMARAVRITYVGELGWELHVPIEQLALVYDTLTDAGKDLGLVNAGHYAINSLRLEKGYRAWGAELSPEDSPLEAGLAFAIDWNKPFLGREALLKQRTSGVRRRLAIFVLEDPDAVLWGSELISRDGQPVGYTTSGSYGHTVGGAIAMGYVTHSAEPTAEFLKSGRYEINVSGGRCAARIHLRAPYDPERKRILT